MKWALLLIILVWIVIKVTMPQPLPWWAFLDVFFAFMAAFCMLAATYLGRMSPHAGVTLNKVAFWCAVLAGVDLVVNFFLL